MRKTATFIHPPDCGCGCGGEKTEVYQPPGIPAELIDDITEFWPFLIAEVSLRHAIGRLMHRTVLEIIRGNIDVERIRKETRDE